jgi:hypothetical protein
MSADNAARARVSRRQLKAAAAARSFDSQYVYGAPPIMERRAKPPATRRPRAPRPSPPPRPKRSAPAPLWSRMTYDQRVVWLGAIHGNPYLPEWVASFLHEVGMGGLDDGDHDPLTVSIIDLLICATRRELFGGAR